MSLSPLSSESNHSSSALADYGINKDNTVVIKVNHKDDVCYSGYEEIEVQTLTEEDFKYLEDNLENKRGHSFMLYRGNGHLLTAF